MPILTSLWVRMPILTDSAHVRIGILTHDQHSILPEVPPGGDLRPHREGDRLGGTSSQRPKRPTARDSLWPQRIAAFLANAGDLDSHRPKRNPSSIPQGPSFSRCCSLGVVHPKYRPNISLYNQEHRMCPFCGKNSGKKVKIVWTDRTSAGFGAPSARAALWCNTFRVN